MFVVVVDWCVISLFRFNCSSSAIFNPLRSTTWMPCTFCKCASNFDFFRNQHCSCQHESNIIHVWHLISANSRPHLKSESGQGKFGVKVLVMIYELEYSNIYISISRIRGCTQTYLLEEHQYVMVYALVSGPQPHWSLPLPRPWCFQPSTFLKRCFQCLLTKTLQPTSNSTHMHSLHASTII